MIVYVDAAILLNDNDLALDYVLSRLKLVHCHDGQR